MPALNPVHFALCWRAVHRPRAVFLLLSTAFGCASAPTPSAVHGLGYPGGSRSIPTETTPRDAPPSVASRLAPSVNPSPAGTNSASSVARELPSERAADGLVSFGNAPIGTSGPFLLDRASADGRWLVVCQARRDSDGDGRLSVSLGPRGEPRGDLLERYLIAPGLEFAVDGLLVSDASGRFALVTERGALLLWDSHTQRVQDLSGLNADLRLSAESFAAVRTLSFDPSSEHLLYVRAGEPSKRLIIRSLRDDTERELEPGPGSIWRARIDPGGVYAVLEMMTGASNGNKKADFPAPLLSAPRACSASPGRFHTFVGRGDHPETVLLPLGGGAPIHEPELVMPIRDALLLRDANGALLLQRAGTKRLLEPAACKGRIVHADPARELFLVGCAQKQKPGRVSVELVSEHGRKPLDIELASVGLDREVSDSPRLVALYPGLETRLFDADREQLLPLRTGDVVLATRGGRALVRRGKALVFYEADTQEERVLPYDLARYPDLLVTPPFAFVSPVLVNLETATVVGLSRKPPLALSTAGQLLVSDGEPDGAVLAFGPLRWITPGL